MESLRDVEGGKNDFIILKHLIKILLVGSVDKLAQLMASDFNLKRHYDQACELNEVLVKEHNYEKLVPILDLFRVQFVSGYMPIEEFGRVCRRYTVSKKFDTKLVIKFRFVQWERFLDLEDSDQQLKQLKLMEDDLKEGKYKAIPCGREAYIRVLYEKICLYLNLKKRDLAQ